MSNLQDFEKLSDLIGAIADRKVRSVSLSITSSTGFLKSLTQSAGVSASAAALSASVAQAASSTAVSNAAAALAVYQAYTASYGGVKTSDPTKTLLNGDFSLGAIYIHAGDGHLRYLSDISNGVFTWSDATIAADINSVISAATGVFLKLDMSTNQTVKGPTVFEVSPLVPSVTSWTSQQATPAVDVNNLFTSLSQSLSNEITRAVTVEQSVADYATSINQRVGNEEVRASAAESNLGQIVTNVNGRVDQEIIDRGAADTTLSTQLSNEISRATTAESNLNTYAIAIDDDRKLQEADLRYRCDVLQDQRNTDTNNLNNTDNYLSGRIDGVIAQHSTDVGNLAAADQANATNISNEITRAQASEGGLNSRIDSEVAQRYNDDQALGGRIDGVIAQRNIDVGNLNGADIANATNISNESTRAQASETNLGGRIDSEVSTRYNDDQYLLTHLNQEITDRQNGDTGIQNNLSNEATRAQSAEGNLSGRIDSEVAQRYNDDQALGGRINQEITDRGNGDNAVQGNLNNEITRAQNAESNLSGRIGAVEGHPYVTQFDNDVTNGYRIWSDGYKEAWGYIDVFSGGSIGVTMNAGFTEWSNVSVSAWIRDSTNAQYNMGMTSHGINDFTVRNWENITLRLEWSARGK